MGHGSFLFIAAKTVIDSSLGKSISVSSYLVLFKDFKIKAHRGSKVDLKVTELLGLIGCDQQCKGQMDAKYYLGYPKVTGAKTI